LAVSTQRCHRFETVDLSSLFGHHAFGEESTAACSPLDSIQMPHLGHRHAFRERRTSVVIGDKACAAGFMRAEHERSTLGQDRPELRIAFNIDGRRRPLRHSWNRSNPKADLRPRSGRSGPTDLGRLLDLALAANGSKRERNRSIRAPCSMSGVGRMRPPIRSVGNPFVDRPTKRAG
jgi:hypothetical protein